MECALLFSNDDVIYRIMSFLGPRYVCIGIGSTCRRLRDVARSDTLWREFWRRRCLLGTDNDTNARNSRYLSSAQDDVEEAAPVHKAAMMFRKAFRDSEVDATADIKQNSSGSSVGTSVNQGDKKTLYAAYAQAHWLLRSTNLRLDEEGESRQIFCTQTWPRSLCDRNDSNRWNNDNTSPNVVTCLNPAEVWCDHPSCIEARCGAQGCLRCYRFLPRDYSLSASGMLVGRQCSERSYDMVTFFKCSWCSVSYCINHISSLIEKPHGLPCNGLWFHCDVCQLSSCSDCVSQVFVRTPALEGCPIVTSGRICGRLLCKNCVWYVGTPRNDKSSNRSVISHQGGMMSPEERESWEVVEACCPQCQPQVETRMKELQIMQNSFMGFMP
ncbi:hypothetical protein HJC23_011364 [Cyclotella cryptica]|uniref:F-box domain-containing protein n=1 Tax=Cyclotella cryptica TaxID=29204 RepID=A0ABD3PQ84_9STRA|eukprot:CCRYP_012642-RA/>CCRYP_012642-RA protein AED:0.03 eAED:0.03 QI:138/1/1/1/1/1/2/209/383